VGNVVGSNIFNLLFVLGVCATVAPQPIHIPYDALRYDIPIMFVVSAACWPVFFTGSTISRGEGLVFLAYYVAYTVFLCLKETDHSQLTPFMSLMLYGIVPLTGLVLLVHTVRCWRRGT
jgi:cation:H+ antiporter